MHEKVDIFSNPNENAGKNVTLLLNDNSSTMKTRVTVKEMSHATTDRNKKELTKNKKKTKKNTHKNVTLLQNNDNVTTKKHQTSKKKQKN